MTIKNRVLTRGLRVLGLLMLAGAFWSAAPGAGPALAGEQAACDFLNQEEVGRVVGFEVAKPESKPANPLGMSICFFDAAKAQGMRFAQLQLVTASSPRLKKMGFTPARLYQNNTGFLEGPEKVEGVGQEALWGGSGLKLGAGLHVLHEKAYFVVLAQVGQDEDCLAKSKELAAVVIGHLK